MGLGLRVARQAGIKYPVWIWRSSAWLLDGTLKRWLRARSVETGQGVTLFAALSACQWQEQPSMALV